MIARYPPLQDVQGFPDGTQEWDDFANNRRNAGMVPPKSHDACHPEPAPAAHSSEAEPLEGLEDLDLGEGGQEVPPPPELPEVSEKAIYKRMYRVFKMREDGSYLVPEELVADWKNKLTRPTVVRLFEKCGYSPEACL